MKELERSLKDALNQLANANVKGVLEGHRMRQSIQRNEGQVTFKSHRGHVFVTTPEGTWRLA